MSYIIDGYNLLHAMGVLTGRVGPQGLEKARRRLLGLLGAVVGSGRGDVTVVFDAAAAPAGAPGEHRYLDIRVCFSAQHQEADDLIEELIRRHSSPRQLAVVSDDHRLQQAAQSRQCRVLGCGEFLDELHKRRASRRPKPNLEPEKSSSLSEHETDQWLAEFKDLEHDPDFQELKRMYDFGEEGEVNDL